MRRFATTILSATHTALQHWTMLQQCCNAIVVANRLVKYHAPLRSNATFCFSSVSRLPTSSSLSLCRAFFSFSILRTELNDMLVAKIGKSPTKRPRAFLVISSVTRKTHFDFVFFNESKSSWSSCKAAFCFARILLTDCSCWEACSSSSRRSFVMSVSRFLLSSIWEKQKN